MRTAVGTAAAMGALGAGYLGLVTGAVPVDLGLRHRTRTESWRRPPTPG